MYDAFCLFWHPISVKPIFPFQFPFYSHVFVLVYDPLSVTKAVSVNVGMELSNGLCEFTSGYTSEEMFHPTLEYFIMEYEVFLTSMADGW